MPTYVAPMITDSVADTSNSPDSNSSLVASEATTNALLLGAAPGQAVAVGQQSLAHSLSLLMLGDTNAHNAFASTSAAIVTATANMLLAGANHV
jgi:hypothetical protein